VKSGIILAESMSDDMKAELVVKTIQKALRRWNIPIGCIFHSDRGSQYTSESVMNLLAKESLRQSFSRVGMPGDNSWRESIFANLKKEPFIGRIFVREKKPGKRSLPISKDSTIPEEFKNGSGYLSPIKWLTR